MSKQIQTYQDLLEEKEKVERLMKAQKDLVRMDLQLLKGEMRPALRAVKTFGKMFTREKDKSIFGVGTERLVDFVFQRFVLNKAGWLAKLVVPVLVKNVSSHVVAENKHNWLHKLRTVLKKKDKHNGQTPPAPDPSATGTEAKKE
jgi:hypothetical protein